MEDYIRYDDLIDGAMRKVVKAALIKVSKDGFPGNHHFLISFLTGFEGVEIPLILREKYPEEMTVVMQHQFEDLIIEEDFFSVVLRFNNVKEFIKVPFFSITSFADPSVRFGLKFNFIGEQDVLDELDSLLEAENEEGGLVEELKLDAKKSKKTIAKKEIVKKDGKKIAGKKSAKSKDKNVISLDFGKKK
jgi:hypothetical protein